MQKELGVVTVTYSRKNSAVRLGFSNEGCTWASGYGHLKRIEGDHVEKHRSCYKLPPFGFPNRYALNAAAGLTQGLCRAVYP